MHLPFLTREQRGLLLKPWQFSPPSIMFYFKLPYLPLYINCPTFTDTKGTCKKLKHGSFARLHWERAHLQQKANA